MSTNTSLGVRSVSRSNCSMVLASVCPSYGLPCCACAATTQPPLLVAALVPLMRFAFADALHLGSMHAVDLVLAVSLLQEQLPAGNQQLLQVLADCPTFCLAFDGTDDATKVRPEFLNSFPCSLELPSVSIPGLLMQYLFANPHVRLPEFDALGFRQVNKSLPSATQ